MTIKNLVHPAISEDNLIFLPQIVKPRINFSTSSPSGESARRIKFNSKILFGFLLFFVVLFGLNYGVLNYEALGKRFSYSFRHSKLTFLPKIKDTAVGLPTVGQAPIQIENNRLKIAKINVDVPIIWNAPTDNKGILEKLREGVAHYSTTALPGDGKGNVFIIGHSSAAPWEPGNYKTVFALLDKLENGDKIQISYENKIYNYEVKNKVVVKPSQVEVLASTEKPTLSLMTCVPVGTNFRRLIVQADLINS